MLPDIPDQQTILLLANQAVSKAQTLKTLLFSKILNNDFIVYANVKIWVYKEQP